MTDERANKPPVKVEGKDYDERVYRKGHPPHRVRNALILIALVIVGTYLAWTKSIPFQSHFELHAVFKNAANIRKDSPVRIAGVNVGKVESVKSVCDNGLTGNCASNYSEVTFTVDDNGQPIHSDAQIEIRPRIFLEGNFFVDVHPGQPERSLALERRHDPGHPDRHGGAAGPDPHLPAGPGPRQPAEAARGIRHGAHPQADRRRRRDAGSRGAGPHGRRGDQQVLRLRTDRRSGLGHRQRGASGDRPARPLQSDRRAGEGLRLPERPRVPAAGPDLQLQHRDRRARCRVRQPAAHHQAARPDAQDRRAVPAPHERDAAVPAGPSPWTSPRGSASCRPRSPPPSPGSTRPRPCSARTSSDTSPASCASQARERASPRTRAGRCSPRSAS